MEGLKSLTTTLKDWTCNREVSGCGFYISYIVLLMN